MTHFSRLLALLLIAAASLPTLLQAQAISERAYQYIQRLQKMMEAEAYDDALTYIGRVESFNMSDYDTAVIAQAKGELLATVERYGESAEAFEKALQLDVLGESKNQQLRLSCGQLFISVEDYEKGIRYLEEWIANEEEPRAEVLITMATAYSRLENFDSALVYVERAIRSAEEPKLTWYDLWIALNFNKNNIEACIDILQEVIALHPSEKKYWKYLSSMYLTQDEPAKSLAVLNLAYERGFVSESKEILHLAKLYLFEGVPVKAAALLNQALQNGQIERSEENFRLLAECWYKSQEVDEAKEAFKSAGQLADTGEHDLYRAQMHLDSEEYEQAVSALEVALDKGIKQEANAIMMLAMAHFQLGQFDQALETLGRAADYPKIADQSEQWIGFIKEEKQRREEYAQLQRGD